MNLLTTFSAQAVRFVRNFARPLFALCLLFWLLPSLLVQAQTSAVPPAVAPGAQDIRTLELGKPVERELAGGQSHAYQITLTEGQYLNAVIEQRGIDVVVKLFAPDGKQLLEVDSPNGAQGPEPLAWIAETAGVYRLEVRSLKKDAQAGRYEAKLIELRPAIASDRTEIEKVQALSEAASLIILANLYMDKGDYDKAEPLMQRALAIREKALSAEHPVVVSSLNSLAFLYFNKGDYGKAELLWQRALAIREKALGPEHLDVAGSLHSLAFLHGKKGDYAKAEPLYLRALAIREKALGAEHPYVALTLNNLFNVYMYKGDYAKAEPLIQRALAIREKALGAEHPDVASSLNSLARVSLGKGDYAKAELLLRRAVAICEKALGPEHPGVAASLSDLASLYNFKGDYAKAEPLYQRVLTIREKALGAEHPDVATSLESLADFYADTNNNGKGDYAKAESLYLRALAIREKALGAEPFDVLSSLRGLAFVYIFRKGDYAKAEPLLQRALAICAKVPEAEHHPNLAFWLSSFAPFYVAIDKPGQALILQLRAHAISEHNIALNLDTGSERQKLAYLAYFSPESDQAISLHTRLAPTDAMARNLALTTILQRKGRALDAMTDVIALLRQRASAADQALLGQLQETTTQLAQMVLNGPQRISPTEHQFRIKSLEEQKEKLEADLSARSAEFRVQAVPVTIATVQAAIPSKAALVEFFNYRLLTPTTTFKYSEWHYVAYVLHQQGEAQWVELGEAKAIDEAIEKLRQALRDKRRKDVKQLARAVDEKVMRPVRALLGQTRRVFLSPDGALNLIPFAALVDERNRYLIQHYSFSYLTSGRDLLRLQVKQPDSRPTKQKAMVIANPDFGGEAKADARQRRLLIYHLGTKAATGEGAVLAGYYFPPLQGTASEARALKAMLKDATLLTQAQATEAAIKQVSGPRLLHIATHGFFLENKKPAAGEDRLPHLLSGNDPVLGQIENPLLRSGLALAGANLQQSGAGEDGILTAQEVAGLDLWGTKLVVLSACDTGVGEVKNGEGVYGLRRALVLAGSETQVMSLWPVSDKGTRDLMIAYYTALQQGEGRSEALRQVQLRMLSSQPRTQTGASRLLVHQNNPSSPAIKQEQRRDYRHPYYWASFIQSGEWANLAGQR